LMGGVSGGGVFLCTSLTDMSALIGPKTRGLEF
jgi:hypothetical protein